MLKFISDVNHKNDIYGNPERKARISYSKETLNAFVKYVLNTTGYITHLELLNFKRLFDLIDESILVGDGKDEMILLIKNVLKARLEMKLQSIDTIISFCKESGNPYEIDKILNNSDYMNFNENDLRYVNDRIICDLKRIHAIWVEDNVRKATTAVIEASTNSEVKEKTDELYNVIKQAVYDFRTLNQTVNSNSFSLRKGYFEEIIKDVVIKSKDKSRIFKTGLVALNNILSPGFMSGRLYTFIARSGNFKSGILLSVVKWIKMYNPDAKAKRNPGAIPTVLLITTENSISETVIRLFNMVLPEKDITIMNPEDVINAMRNEGGLAITEENRIDIRMEYRNDREIDTEDIYGIIEDIEIDGYEVVALVVDYIKRIRPVTPSKDEITELKNVTSELKNLAINLDIPVITAMQMNRAGNSAIESAMNDQKSDLAKFVGVSNVANSWAIVENSDWVCLINIEQHLSSKQYYLTFKLGKIRYADKSGGQIYFNQPFADGDKIRLEEDVNIGHSLAVESLGEDIKPTKKESPKRPTKVLKEEESLEDYILSSDF